MTSPDLARPPVATGVLDLDRQRVSSLPTTSQRAAEWIWGIDSLFARRPDLEGAYALADVALATLKSAV